MFGCLPRCLIERRRREKDGCGGCERGKESNGTGLIAGNGGQRPIHMPACFSQIHPLLMFPLMLLNDPLTPSEDSLAIRV